jgi:hypothetical protein
MRVATPFAVIVLWDGEESFMPGRAGGAGDGRRSCPQMGLAYAAARSEHDSVLSLESAQPAEGRGRHDRTEQEARKAMKR